MKIYQSTAILRLHHIVSPEYIDIIACCILSFPTLGCFIFPHEWLVFLYSVVDDKSITIHFCFIPCQFFYVSNLPILQPGTLASHLQKYFLT